MAFFGDYLFLHFLLNREFGFKYENEFDAMRYFLRREFSSSSRELACIKISSSYKKEPAHKLIKKSEDLSKQGYKLFRTSPTKYALSAARFYTKAIFVAPLGSEALATAHANRAEALYEFGYYKQAYDDCVCALEQGYPRKYKINILQGNCALKLGDANLLEQHLNTINNMKLNKSVACEVQKLQDDLACLELQEQNANDAETQIAHYRDKLEIKTSRNKGRFIVATKPLKNNEFIFSDHATSFIPYDEIRICQKCAATQLIPFPCYRCSGKVVYCSVKCRKAHEATHEYECTGYDIGFFPNKPEVVLGLRMILDGIKQVEPFLCAKRTAKEVWHELTNVNSELLQKTHLEYVQVLRRVSHLDKKQHLHINSIGQLSVDMLAYLSTLTSFFNDHFKESSLSRSEWELIIGSLIMRHFGQNMLYHNQIGYTITSVKADIMDFDLMEDKLWYRPFHVRRGCLHQKMRRPAHAFRANYTLFGLMNHKCDPSVKLKQTGCYLSVFATKDIKSGEELSTDYLHVADARKEIIKKTLKEAFDFECDCSNCTQGDDDNEKFHRYRCENSKCHSIFIPNSNVESLYWWTNNINGIRCTKCNYQQCKLLEYTAEIHSLIKSLDRSASRYKVFKLCNDLDRWLLGNHKFKYIIMQDIAVCSLTAHVGGSTFAEKDFVMLNKICKTMMNFANEIRKLDVEYYICSLSCTWDLIALGKYKCSTEDMQTMLETIETAPDEIKKIMMNYYNDFITKTIKKSN